MAGVLIRAGGTNAAASNLGGPSSAKLRKAQNISYRFLGTFWGARGAARSSLFRILSCGIGNMTCGCASSQVNSTWQVEQNQIEPALNSKVFTKLFIGNLFEIG